MSEPTGPYFHGGVPGLQVGDLLTGGHSRDDRHPGCKMCEARKRAATLGGMDPPSSHPDHVYLTTDRLYARFHASLYGRGDLYIAQPVGELEASTEDPFPAFFARSARIVAVPEHGVLLHHSERRKLFLRWARADGIGRSRAEEEFRRMLGNFMCLAALLALACTAPRPLETDQRALAELREKVTALEERVSTLESSPARASFTIQTERLEGIVYVTPKPPAKVARRAGP